MKTDYRLKPCQWNGQAFASITECAKFNNITVTQQINRFKRGYTCELWDLKP